MALVLTDQGGHALPRFGAAGVKKVLTHPVKPTLVCKHLEYAMVWCEAADTFIMRIGYGKDFDITIIYWKDAEADDPTEEHFVATKLDSAIKRFVTLSKRKT